MTSEALNDTSLQSQPLVFEELELAMLVKVPVSRRIATRDGPSSVHLHVESTEIEI